MSAKPYSIEELRKRLNTTKAAGAVVAPAPAATPVAAPVAAPAAAPTQETTLERVAKLAAVATGQGAPAAAPVPVATPAAANPPKGASAPAKLSDEQLTKLAREGVDKDTVDSFEKLAYTVGVLVMSSEDGYKTAHEYLAKAKGAQIADELMAKAAYHQQAVHQQLAAEEDQLRKEAHAQHLLQEAFAQLPADEQNYVKRAHAALATQAALIDKQLHADLLTLDTTKEASEEDKNKTSDFLIRRAALLKGAMAGGASDAMAMMDQAGPEGENIEAAGLPGSELNAEGIPEDLTPEQIVELIDMAVQNGDIPPEVGEQMKAALLQGSAGIPEGPGAEDAKAAHVLVSKIVA